MLEAKLIAANGFAISLATEWIVNPAGEYDQQDCERKGFFRLAAPLKQQYLRLPLCLTADGLYPHQGFFEICRDSGWAFIITFKDGNLPTVWEDVQGLLPLTPAQCRHERRYHGSTVIEQRFRWVNHLAYGGHTLAWLEGVEVVTPRNGDHPTHHRFVHLTNLTVTAGTVVALSRTGRLRWKIENEGFNTQKHLGYGLEHHDAQVSWQAAKNYYQCLQIGHLINQLTILSTTFQTHLPGKMTCRHRWQCLLALRHQEIACSAIQASPINPLRRCILPQLDHRTWCRLLQRQPRHRRGVEENGRDAPGEGSSAPLRPTWVGRSESLSIRPTSDENRISLVC